jgi:hypothetical protein
MYKAQSPALIAGSRKINIIICALYWAELLGEGDNNN